MTLASLVDLGIKSSAAIMLVGLGLTAFPGDATSLFRAPVKLGLSMLAMMLIVPLFGIVVAHTFELEPAVAIAVVALSVSPVPPFWMNRTRRVGGAEAYAVSLFVASSMLALPLIPIALSILESIFSIQLRTPAAAIVSLTLGWIVVPIGIGIAIGRLAPRAASRWAGVLSKIGISLLVVSAAPMLVKSWPDLSSVVGDGTMLTMVAFSVVGLIAGYVLGGPTEEERSVLALAAASRHPGVALALAQANFPHQKLIPAAIILYLLVSGTVCLSFLWWRRHHLRRDEQAAVVVWR